MFSVSVARVREPDGPDAAASNRPLLTRAV